MCRQRSFHTHYSRLVDDSPAPNIQSCVFVRERNVPAGLADKLGLVPAIGLIAIPALATGTRSVARINRCQGDPGEPSLVLDESSKLAESPLGVSRTLRLPNRGSFPNALKVFETYSPAGFGGLEHEPLADDVVGVFLHAPLAL